MNGVSKDEIDKLTTEEALVLWKLWVSGAWGNFGSARQSYYLYSSIHDNTQASLMVAPSKKRHKYKQPLSMSQFDPHMFSMATGKAEEQPVQQSISLTASETLAKLGISKEEDNG